MSGKVRRLIMMGMVALFISGLAALPAYATTIQTTESVVTTPSVPPKAPALVKVPNVVGMHYTKAVKVLTAKGFKVQFRKDWPTTNKRKDGRIKYQTPRGKQKVGTTVTLLKYRWRNLKFYLHWRLHFECRRQHVPQYWAHKFFKTGHRESGWCLRSVNGSNVGWLQMSSPNPRMRRILKTANGSCKFAIKIIKKQGRRGYLRQWPPTHDHSCGVCSAYLRRHHRSGCP
jgi:hypothetical protein